MLKKNIFFHIAFIATLFIGCSDDTKDSNPLAENAVLEQDDSEKTPYIDPATGDYIDPATGDTIPTIPYVDPNTGDTVPAIQVVDPSTGDTIALPIDISSSAALTKSSSSVTNDSSSSENTDNLPENPSSQPDETSSSSENTNVSSSSGLKEYEDNHKPKGSILPKAGFYNSLTIDPPSPQKSGEIRCTFDGSFPTQNSEQITQAIQITENTVIRCSEFVNGQPADTTTQTYFIGENVSMPVVALTVNHHDMFDSTDGLYATGPLTNNGSNWNFGGNANVTDNNNPKCTEPCKAANFWRDDELPVHVEFFENGSSSTEKNWEIDAGISIIGNYSRYKPKKSVAIKMDNDDYGDKVLKYSLFKTRPEAKKIKSFNLRNNGNRFWTDYIGDAMMTALMEGTDVDYQRSRQVVVFYNGEYFGIHDLRERLNRNFVETNYGIDSKSINMIKISGTNFEASGTNGASTADYQQLVNQISSGNFAGENNQEYEQLKSKINLNSFAQYMFAEMYFHNGDWPNNNVRAWGGNGNPFKFVAFDTDHGFGFTPGISGFDAENQNMFDWVLGKEQGSNQGQGGMWGGFGSWGSTDSRAPGGMLKKLLENPDFKRLFINNACILLNDYLTYERVQSTVHTMMATIPNSEQERDQKRWPRNQSNFTWDPNGDNLIAYARTRSETIRQEMADRFKLETETKVTITADGSGSILVDGMKLPSSNYQGKFFANTEMELTAIPATGRFFDGWSDGSKDNPHKIQLTSDINISAKFK